MKIHFGIAFCALGVPAISHAGNLFANGDFEQGNVGYITGLNYNENLGIVETTYCVGTNPYDHHWNAPWFGDHTSGLGKMMIINGAVSPDVTVWQETVSVTAGASYAFSGWTASWGMTPSGVPQDPSPANLIVTVNGKQIGAVWSPVAQDGLWRPFSAQWTAGVNDTSAVVRIVDLNMASVGNDYVLDDLSFQSTAVPELPSSLFLGVGSLSLIFVKRRRR